MHISFLILQHIFCNIFYTAIKPKLLPTATHPCTTCWSSSVYRLCRKRAAAGFEVRMWSSASAIVASGTGVSYAYAVGYCK